MTYADMVLESDRVPFRINFAAAFCSWWTMAGFLVLPGAFMSLEKSKVIQIKPVIGEQNQVILMIFAAFFFATGAGGICYIGNRFRHNYVWLSNRLIIPTLASAANCLYAILVNIYTAQGGYWSWPAYFAFTSVVFTMISTLSAVAFYQYKLRSMDN